MEPTWSPVIERDGYDSVLPRLEHHAAAHKAPHLASAAAHHLARELAAGLASL